jgi:hypothetical protein
LLKYQQCHCDAGYEGDDCSLRQCPRGDDPETECNTDRGEDIQKLTCAFQGGAKKAFFQLRFTDQFGGEYDTRPIKVDVDNFSEAQNANSIQDALEALPNFAIPQVEVDFDMTVAGSKTAPKIDVKFTDGHNTGKQQILAYIAKAACVSGSQPLFRTAAANGDLTCTIKREDLPVGSNYRESSTCSDRGICDQSTGRCNCFDGFFGLACDHVNTYI